MKEAAFSKPASGPQRKAPRPLLTEGFRAGNPAFPVSGSLGEQRPLDQRFQRLVPVNWSERYLEDTGCSNQPSTKRGRRSGATPSRLRARTPARACAERREPRARSPPAPRYRRRRRRAARIGRRQRAAIELAGGIELAVTVNPALAYRWLARGSDELTIRPASASAP